MNHQELIERMRGFEIDHDPKGWPAIQMRDISDMCNAIESLLAENERLKAELAKYRDAPVVAYLYKYRNCFGDEVWTTNHNWGNRIPFESKPLIVKPGENK